VPVLPVMPWVMTRVVLFTRMDIEKWPFLEE
jgi:hypothetical protein